MAAIAHSLEAGLLTGHCIVHDSSLTRVDVCNCAFLMLID
jgi:hypothetical protein